MGEIDIDELNRRYGAPGRIAFRKGFGGYPEAVLAGRYGTAEIALLGGSTLSYRPTGHSQVLFRPAKRDHRRGESFHGGIPVCWPQFGKLAIKGMAPHGFAKVMVFDVRGTAYSEEMTEITLGLRSNGETRALWPYDFDLELKISVSMKLNLTLTTKNTGSTPFEFSAGFHPYFLVRDRDAVSVRGLDGCPYVYAEDMSEHVMSGDLKMDRATDHVFTLPKAPKHEFALLDPGLGRAVAVASGGSGAAVVWNPGPGAGINDLEADDWRRFVCLEPVTSWPGPLAPLAPGETSVLVAAVQSVADTSNGEVAP